MDDVATYADEHEGGQLRIACPGEQVPLLGLPDSAIPTSDEPQAVDELRHRPEHDFWMTHPGDPDYLAPADRWCRVCTRLDSDSIHDG